MLKNVVLHSVATALANIVLPVPVGEREGGRKRERGREGEKRGREKEVQCKLYTCMYMFITRRSV